jgi:hypothetical protein
METGAKGRKKNMIVKELLKRPIAYHAVVAKATKSVKVAVLWGQLYYWKDKGSDPNGWIYKTQEELYNETGLTRRNQATARKKAIEMGIMEENRRGENGKMHFRITEEHEEALITMIDQYLEKKQKTLFEQEKEEEQFSMDKELQKLDENERREMNIIALYLRERDAEFTNKAQFQKIGIKRNLRPAKDLIDFEDEQILWGVELAKKEYPEVWTLETVGKMFAKHGTNRKG